MSIGATANDPIGSPVCASQEANKKHSVNGFLFCNMPDIVVPEGAKLRLILIGAGGDTDMHTPGFSNLVQNTPSGASYVVELYPGQARVVGMYAGAQRSLSLSVLARHLACQGPKGHCFLHYPSTCLDTSPCALYSSTDAI